MVVPHWTLSATYEFSWPAPLSILDVAGLLNLVNLSR